MASNTSDLRVEIITNAEDIISSFDCTCKTFGSQTQDAIWIVMNPGWDTPEGKAKGAQRMVDRWIGVKKDNKGELNVMHVMATLPDPEREGERILVGVAIWVHASAVEGQGDVPVEDTRADLEALYPGNEAEQRYGCQLLESLHRRRFEVIREKATASPPTVMVLDLCVVDPAFQGKGIARKLVQWGLDEAQRRGGIEAILEGSSMGRHLYAKMGFKAEGDVEYIVDAEFADRNRPANLFMRTQGR
ncbi:acetyltransferase [Ilyonectria destructans]|nr:acetyltransferase [Ilyonectria destructans]